MSIAHGELKRPSPGGATRPNMSPRRGSKEIKIATGYKQAVPTGLPKQPLKF